MLKLYESPPLGFYWVVDSKSCIGDHRVPVYETISIYVHTKAIFVLTSEFYKVPSGDDVHIQDTVHQVFKSSSSSPDCASFTGKLPEMITLSKLRCSKYTKLVEDKRSGITQKNARGGVSFNLFMNFWRSLGVDV